MTTQDYQQLILKGTQDLPPENLEEIVDFIFFIRQKLFHPQAFDKVLQANRPVSGITNENSPDDTAWSALAESAFEFWDNEEDAIYDTL